MNILPHSASCTVTFSVFCGVLSFESLAMQNASWQMSIASRAIISNSIFFIVQKVWFSLILALTFEIAIRDIPDYRFMSVSVGLSVFASGCRRSRHRPVLFLLRQR